MILSYEKSYRELVIIINSYSRYKFFSLSLKKLSRIDEFIQNAQQVIFTTLLVTELFSGKKAFNLLFFWTNNKT